MPVPVIVLASIIGLLVYVAIGGVVSTLLFHLLGDGDPVRVIAGKDARGYTDENMVWLGYVFSVILWPLAILVVLGYPLARFALRTGRYAANAIEERSA